MAFTQHSVNYRDGLVAGIKAAIPEKVCDVRSYDGKVDPESLATESLRLPSILVTMLGSRTTTRGGTVYDVHSVGVYVVTRHEVQTKRDAMALILKERLCRVVPYLDLDGKFGGLDGPRAIEWQNRFDGKVKDMGLALWIGAWLHATEYPAIENYDDLDDFATLWVEIFDPGEVPATVETGTALTEQQIDLETV